MNAALPLPKTMPRVTLIGPTRQDTIQRCSAVVSTLGNLVGQASDGAISDEDRYGVFLILNGVAEVLNWVSDRDAVTGEGA